MKNSRIEHAHNEARIYKDYYRPSLNPLHLLRSIFSVLFTGNSATAHSYEPGRRKRY